VIQRLWWLFPVAILVLGAVRFLGWNLGQPPHFHETHESRRSWALEVVPEMYRVLLRKNPPPQDYEGWVEVLTQGASLEGVYRGLVTSSGYRSLETRGPKISLSSLEYWVRDWKKSASFFRACGDRIPSLIWSDRLAQASPLFPSDPQPVISQEGKPPGINSSFQEWVEFFSETSVATFARVMTNLYLRGSQECPQSSRMDWYGPWAADVARRARERHINLGHELRLRDSAEFHRVWAGQMTLDRVHWEMVNKINRLLE